MVDLLPTAAELLKTSGAQIELTEPEAPTTIPLILLSEAGNSTEAIAEGNELYSSVLIQTDVYHYDESRARQLAIFVSEKLSKGGFTRLSTLSIHEDGLVRITSRFRAFVNETINKIIR